MRKPLSPQTGDLRGPGFEWIQRVCDGGKTRVSRVRLKIGRNYAPITYHHLSCTQVAAILVVVMHRHTVDKIPDYYRAVM